MTETLSLLGQGFATALQPMMLLWALVGCFLGTAVGVLPGIGPALAIAMLLPVTGKIEPTASLILFAGIYYGAMYGGSTTSILLNTPGESATMITAMEGNKMAKRGRAGAALATAAIGSFIAGTMASVLVVLLAPKIADWALAFGPAEYFALMVLAFVTVSAVLGESTLRGLTSLFLGLAIGVIGMDSISGQARFTFGKSELVDGIEVTLVAVGLFAVAEALHAVWFERPPDSTVGKIAGRLMMTAQEWKESWPAWLRGAVIGFPFGTVPAGGSEIPTFLSYAAEKKLSKNPEQFGHGAIAGVAGPEAANNASSTATLIPLLTLGIPTTATAAMMLAALQNYNLQVGPMLFQQSAPMVWGLLASLFVGNAMLLVLNLPLIRLWVKLLTIPRPQLYAGILVFATIGAYGMRQSAFDLLLLYVIGVIGVLMRRFGFSAAPVIIGMILGPMAERNLRNALSIGQGDWSALVKSPISIVVLSAAALLLIVPRVVNAFRR
jgi:putative tricarboxylic transport membrane protein